MCTSDDVSNCLINSRAKSLSAGPISIAGENQQEENESVRNAIQLINLSYLIHHALPSSKRELLALAYVSPQSSLITSDLQPTFLSRCMRALLANVLLSHVLFGRKTRSENHVLKPTLLKDCKERAFLNAKWLT